MVPRVASLVAALCLLGLATPASAVEIYLTADQGYPFLSPGESLNFPRSPTKTASIRTSRMNGVAEGVRQVRGSAVNQVPNVENVLVTAGTAVPTSALILSQPN